MLKNVWVELLPTIFVMMPAPIQHWAQALTLTHGLGVYRGFGFVESRLPQNIQSWFFKEKSWQSV